MLDLDIQIIKTTTPKEKPTDESTLGFGKLFTDHMFIVEYTEGIGWHDARIQPYGPLAIDPASPVLHYSQEIFAPVGDAFADRNKYAMQIDFEQQPPMFEISETHRAATWLLHPDAPKVEIPKIITDRIERMKKKAGGATNEQ